MINFGSCVNSLQKVEIESVTDGYEGTLGKSLNVGRRFICNLVYAQAFGPPHSPMPQTTPSFNG